MDYPYSHGITLMHKLQGPSPFMVQLSCPSTLRVLHTVTLVSFIQGRMKYLSLLGVPPVLPQTLHRVSPLESTHAQNPMIFPRKELCQQGPPLAFHPISESHQKNQVVRILSQGTFPEPGALLSTRSRGITLSPPLVLSPTRINGITHSGPSSPQP